MYNSGYNPLTIRGMSHQVIKCGWAIPQIWRFLAATLDDQRVSPDVVLRFDALEQWNLCFVYACVDEFIYVVNGAVHSKET